MSAPLEIGARRASADIAVQVVGRFLNLALGVVVTLLIVRALGARGFGEWSTILAVTQIAGNLGELGLGQVAVSRAATDPGHDASWLGALLSLRLLLAIPIAVTSAVAVLLIAPSHASRVAGVLVSCTLVIGAPTALNAVFQLRVRNGISTAILTLNSVLWAAGVFAVATASGGIVWFAGALVAVSALTSAATIACALRITPIRLRGTRHLWSTLVRVGLTVGAAGIFVTFYVKLDQILVLEFAGTRQAGLYGAAYRILDQVQFVPASVMTTLFPVIASFYPADLKRVRELLQSAAEYLTIASLPILAFTIAAAHPIIALLFGHQFLAAAPALPILMAAFVAISFGYLAGSMVVVVEIQRDFLRFAAVGLLVNALLNVVLIPRYGFLAAAWITLLTEITVMSLTMRRVMRVLGMRPRVNRLARTVLAATLMALATWLARGAGAPLGALVAVAASSYALALALLGVLTPADIRRLLREDAQAPQGPPAQRP